MSKVKINIENYESFYLDYLEDNLEQDDTLELFAFLDRHPELKVENDFLALDQDETRLEPDFKNLLKVDLLSENISLNNVDYFLLAQKENQLSAEKSKALASFIQKHPAFENDRQLYAMSTLVADTSIRYRDKNKLKRGAKILLWPYYSAAAAACLVFFVWFAGENRTEIEAVSAARGMMPNPTKVEIVRMAADTLPNEPRSKEVGGKGMQAKKVEKANTLNPRVAPIHLANDPSPNPSPSKIKVIDDQKINQLTIAFENEVPAKSQPNSPSSDQNDYSLALKDVAPPVTRKLSEIIKTEVKLKKGQDAKGNREGLFFKVGTFEFYRNRKVKP